MIFAMLLCSYRFVRRIAAVELKDIERVAQKYLGEFLKPDNTQTSISCGPGEVESIRDFFKDLGFEMKIIQDLEDSILV